MLYYSPLSFHLTFGLRLSLRLFFSLIDNLPQFFRVVPRISTCLVIHPNYSHLCCFGCAYFVLLPPRERTKLTAQLVECVFLWYNTEHKGYRCYDHVACRMRVSRDVTFDESRPFFPCFSSSSSSTTTESISFLTLPDESLLLPSTPPSPSYAPSIVPPPPPISLLSRFLGLLPSRFLLPLLCLLHCPLVLLL